MAETSILRFDDLRREDLARLDGKNASLGERIAYLGQTGELLVGRDVTLSEPTDDPPDSYFTYAQLTPLGTVLVGKDDGRLMVALIWRGRSAS